MLLPFICNASCNAYLKSCNVFLLIFQYLCCFGYYFESVTSNNRCGIRTISFICIFAAEY